MISVSAIVVTYHTGQVLWDCLAALEREGIPQIVIVDNGNPEPVSAALGTLSEGSGGRYRHIGGGTNRGFAAGVNLGATIADGARLLVINPDAVLQPGALAALETALEWAVGEGAAEPIVVGGRIAGDDGVEQRGCRRRALTLGSAAGTFLGLSRLAGTFRQFAGLNLNREPEPAGPTDMPVVSGALMYMSRTSFDALHGFDEGYFLHVEDIDLCRRAADLGGRVVYTPLARAHHVGGASAASKLFVERCKARGLARYFSKFARTRTEKSVAALLGPAIGVALIARAIIAPTRSKT